MMAVLAALIGWALFSRENRQRFPTGGSRLRTQSSKSPSERGVVSNPPWLQDITSESGLDFQHVIGPLGTYFVPEINGAGGALFDYDKDGLLDILLINSGRSPQAAGDFPEGTRTENRLYRQQPDGTFLDSTDGSGLGGPAYGIGCAVGDIDNDGALDVYVTNYGPDQLYRNNADGTFENITQQARIVDSEWGTCAAFFDYDRDDWLDLVVINYTSDPAYDHSVACGFTVDKVSYCGPHKFRPTVDQLYHNEGLSPDSHGQPHVTFRDVTHSSGLGRATTAGFAVICADLTGDHWPDIYVANDMAPNRLWVNQHDGTFQEEALVRGIAVSSRGLPQGSMGVAVGDVDEDLDLDLVVTNLATESANLFQNDGQGMFVDTAPGSELWRATRTHTGWGLALVDLDHDGDLDLPIVNGLVVPGHSGFPPHGEDVFQVNREVIANPSAFLQDYYDDNLLLMNAGQGRWLNETRSGGSFCTAKGSARALITGDIDQDGDVDLLVTNCGERAILYRNDIPKRGHWIALQLMDPRLNREAYGAEVIVYAGDRRYLGIVNPSSSYLASNDSRVHFGLGNSESVQRFVVRWPDGLREEFAGVRADRTLTLRRGEGQADPPGSEASEYLSTDE